MNKQLTMNNRKGKVSNHSMELKSKDNKQRHCPLPTAHCSLFTVHCSLFTVHCSLFTVHCSLFIALCSLFIAGCDLFNNPVDPYYLDKIREEIMWSNAARLTVTVDYPQGWGSSPQYGTNRIYDDRRTTQTPRFGYSFSAEFTPDTAYAFKGWRAYETSAITAEALEGDWRLDPSLLDDVDQLDDIEIPELGDTLSSRGGKGSFTSNTVAPITLIPWCETEPYVIRTEPRGQARDNASSGGVHPSTEISIYFNSALDLGMEWIFTDGIVDIQARPISSIEEDDGFFGANDWFSEINYSSRAGQHILVITPKGGTEGPELEHQIQVTVGPNIRNDEGNAMSQPEVFYYKVSEIEGVDASITGWEIDYDAGTITVDIEGDDTDTAMVVFRYGQSAEEIALNRSTNVNTPNRFSGRISIQGSPDSSSVISGRSVSGIQEARIIIEAQAGGYTSDLQRVSIWNVPGMIVTHNNTHLLNSFNFYEVMQNIGSGKWRAGDNYVLTEDAYYGGAPIGTNASPFTGKFYGNGYTVTSSINTAADMGLFGVVSGNAVVRDLTVNYNNLNLNPEGDARFGGIAGRASGNARIENVLVKGTVVLYTDGDAISHIGGIVGLLGRIEETETISAASISNAYSGVDLRIGKNAASGAAISIYAGGIAGSIGATGVYTGTGSSADPISVTWAGDAVTVENVVCASDLITVGEGNPVSVVSHGYTDTTRPAGLIVGGIAGMIIGEGEDNRAVLRNSDYRGGSILIDVDSGHTIIGGAVGQVYRHADVSRCSSVIAKDFIINKTGSGMGIAGGFIGELWSDAMSSDLTTGDIGNERIEYCYSENPVTLLMPNIEDTIFIGGFCGRIAAGVSYSYAKGDVSGSCNSEAFAGGFAGTLTSTSFAVSCYAAGDVSVTAGAASNPVHAGGFAGSSVRVLSNSYALGDVFAEKPSGGAVNAGGFVGTLNEGGGVERSFAIGSVRVQRSSGVVNAGGLVGAAVHIYNTYISGSAALGASVTATGSGTINVGRVYGYSADYGGTVYGKYNNYAWDGMKIFKNSTTPENISTNIVYNDHNTNNGVATPDSVFRRRDIWQNPAPAGDAAPNAANGMFFQTSWDMSTVTARGYPILREVGGQ